MKANVLAKDSNNSTEFLRSAKLVKFSGRFMKNAERRSKGKKRICIKFSPGRERAPPPF